MVAAAAKITSGSAMTAARSQCSVHSARPYSPADAGVRMSRRKRFIFTECPTPSGASYGEPAANSISAAMRESSFYRCWRGASVRQHKTKIWRKSMAQAQRKQEQRDWPFQVKPLHPALGCEIDRKSVV